MRKFFDANGEPIFSSNAQTEEEILDVLKSNNVVKRVDNLVIDEDHEGRLFITDGVEEIATVDP